MSEYVAPRVPTSRAARVLLAALLAVGAVVLVAHFGKQQAFFFDEWELVLQRRGWDAGTLLTPLNEHLFLIPLTVFKVLLELVGLSPHWVFQLPVVAAHLATTLLVFLLARRRVGDWLALGMAAVLLFLGSAWEDLLMPIQVSFVGAMSAGLAMLLVLDRRTGLGSDLACAVLLAISLACSGIGLSFVAVALVEVVGLPGWPRRLWVVAAPALLWLLWFAAYGTTKLQAGGDARTNIPLLPSYVADEVAAAAGAVAGLSLERGRVLAPAAVALVVRALIKRDASVHLLSLLAGAISFWTLTGVARAHLEDPGAPRYLYVGVVFVLLIGAELARGRAPAGRVGSALLAAAVLVCVLGNLNVLRGGRDTYRDWSEEISARLAALELVGPRAAGPEFQPAPSLAPRLYAGDYFSGVQAFGSPATSLEALPTASERARRGADDVLVRALAVRPLPGSRPSAGPRLVVDRIATGRLQASFPCLVVAPTGNVVTLDVTAPPTGVLVRARGDEPADVSVRRFADTFGPTLGTVPRGEERLVRVPPLTVAKPWHVRVTSESGVEICRAAD